VRYRVARVLAAGWPVVLILGSTAPADIEQMQSANLFGDFVLHVLGYGTAAWVGDI
jgi:hypothetical protein